MGFNPERLVVARHRRGLSQTALSTRLKERFGADGAITARRIRAYENEGEEPPARTLDRIASTLGFPTEWFTQPSVVAPNDESFSFRAGSRLTAKSRDTAKACARIAIEVTDWLERNFDLPEPNLPDLTHVDGAAAAAAVRSTWGLGEQPAPHIIQTLEAHGVRVFSLAEEINHVDAFSFWAAGQPFIFLSKHKSPERARWDAAHELGHLVLHRHGGGSEADADDFASAYLLPDDGVRARTPLRVDLTTVLTEKLHWRVSAMAYIRSLHRLGITTEWQYRNLVIEASKAGYRRSEGDIERESSKLIPMLVDVLANEGTDVSTIARDLNVEVGDLRSLLFLPLALLDGGGSPTSQARPRLRLVEDN